MSDGAKTSLIESFIADTLAALEVSGVAVFKTAAVWSGQVHPEKGGIEAFSNYIPFAFVAYEPGSCLREGDHDLNTDWTFSVIIGQVSSSDGIARYGDSAHLGTNMLEELVIAALDHAHPTDVDCDDLAFDGSFVVVDRPRFSAIQLTFKCPRTGN